MRSRRAVAAGVGAAGAAGAGAGGRHVTARLTPRPATPPPRPPPAPAQPYRTNPALLTQSVKYFRSSEVDVQSPGPAGRRAGAGSAALTIRSRA